MVRRPEALDWPIVSEAEPLPVNRESLDGLLRLTAQGILRVAHNRICVLLSGGLDSSMLTGILRSRGINFTCLTIVAAPRHPDGLASRRLARDLGLSHVTVIPTARETELARDAVSHRSHPALPGDEAVWLACRHAAQFGASLIATDGIDELMGGYADHVWPSSRPGMTQRQAFEARWAALWSNHLLPLAESASEAGLELRLPFLTPDFVSFVTRFPLGCRTCGRTPKALWRVAATKYVPEWVLARKKVGMWAALDPSTNGLSSESTTA